MHVMGWDLPCGHNQRPSPSYWSSKSGKSAKKTNRNDRSHGSNLQGLECGKCGGVTWFWSSLFLSELLRAGLEELCLWATGNGGGRGTTRLAFPVTRLYTGGLEAAIVRGGSESAMAYPPKNAKLQRCFVLNGDLHQSSKSKGCFLLCCVCIFAHDSSEVNKLHRGMEAKNQYDLNQVIFESASWKKMKKRSRCFRT